MEGGVTTLLPIYVSREQYPALLFRTFAKYIPPSYENYCWAFRHNIITQCILTLKFVEIRFIDIHLV